MGDNPIGNSWNIITDAAESVGQWVGDRLGISPRDETITDIQMINLLTPKAADKNARKNCIRGSGGDMMQYSQAYMGFQRDYRKKYSKQFLTSLGYAPSTTATTRVINGPSALTYLQAIDPLAVNIQLLLIKYISTEEAAYDWMEDNIGWSNNLRTIDIGDGKTWKNLLISDDGTFIQMDFTRDATETIVENLTNNYSYNIINSTVILNTGPNTALLSGTSGIDTKHIRLEITDQTPAVVETISFDVTASTYWEKTTLAYGNGTYHVKVYETDTLDIETLTSEYDITIDDTELYDVPELDTTDFGGYYRTTVVLQSDGITTYNIDTVIEALNYNISNTVTDNEKMFIRYDRGASEWYYYTEDLTTVPESLYTSVSIDMSAIIPLKEDNIIIDGGIKQERMLKKLNISPELFTDSLNNQDLDSLYVMTGVYPGVQHQAGIKTVFNMFDLLQEGSGDVSLSISKLSMTYSFTMDKDTINGTVLPVGQYSNVLTESIGGTVEDPITFYTRTIRYQATDTQYKQIVITNYLQTYKISGQTIEVSFADGESVSRLLIPLNVLNRLRYKEFVEVYEDSLCMLGYAVEIVHYEWYESSNFSVLMQIVAIVVMVIAVIIAIPTGGQSLYWGSVFWTFAINLAINVAVGMAIGYVLKEIINYLVDQLGLDPVLAGAIAMVAALAIASQSGQFHGVEQYLPLANAAVDATSAVQSEMMSDLTNMDEVDLKEFVDKNQDTLDMITNMRGTGPTFNMNIASIPAGGESVQDQLNRWTDTSIMASTDIMYDIDGAYHMRKNVVVA